MFKYLNIFLGLGAGAVAALLVGVYVLPRLAAGEGEVTRVLLRTRDLEIDANAFSFRAARSSAILVRPTDLTATSGGKLLGEGGGRGRAVWLTSDGWLLAGTPVARDFQVLTFDGRVLPIEQRVLDDATGAVFLKVGARDESAAPAASPGSLRVGDQVFIVPVRGRVIVRRVADLRALDRGAAPGAVESSDALGRRIVLDAPLPDDLRGAPIWNARGEVAGLAVSGAVALPIDAVLAIQESVFRTGKVLRPTLGIKGIDLTSFAAPPADLENKRGVLVVSSRRSEIKAGDLITALDDAQLDGARSLFEILIGYKPGDEIIFSLIRAGTSLKSTIKI